MLEVLNQGSVIFKNSLDSFKKASSYWGVRYYGTGRPEYWSNYYPQVVNAGWDQHNYQPSYSFTAFYTEGKTIVTNVWNSTTKKWETKTTLRKAKFRCDTFVVYSFKKGIHVDVRPALIIPTSVWTWFTGNYIWFSR